MRGYSNNREDVQRRLRRVEGQIRGLQRMVEQDAYCIDVLTQISAATKALQAVALELLDGHLNTCVADAIGRGGTDARTRSPRRRPRWRDSCVRELGTTMIGALIALVSPSEIGHSLREAFFMFWETLWALILGFALSGAVQAFVSKDEMQRVLGDHRPASIVRASGFGMVSSSCSYAASAMAKSLFHKGADFVSAMVFMFASTNLVVELGIVLIVLMGWRFAAAEFIGGPIMIVLLAVTSAFVSAVPWSKRLARGSNATTARNPVAGSNAPLGATSSGAARGGPTPPASRLPISRCCGRSL